MRDKKIISFKEFYLREDHHTGYFPTLPGIAKGAAKGAWGAAKLGAKGVGGAAKLGAKAARGLYKGAESAAKGAVNFAKSMDPGYKKQFSVGAPIKGAGGLSDSKSTREAARRFAEWREKNITAKDGKTEEAKTFEDFKKSAIEVPENIFKSQNLPGMVNSLRGKVDLDEIFEFFTDPTTGEQVPTKLRIGQELPLMVLMAGDAPVGIVDGKYKREGTAWPKIFGRPGHYANQVVDSMKRYFDTGYKKNQSVDMASKNFNQDGLAILRRNKYLPWESL